MNTMDEMPGAFFLLSVTINLIECILYGYVKNQTTKMMAPFSPSNYNFNPKILCNFQNILFFDQDEVRLSKHDFLKIYITMRLDAAHRSFNLLSLYSVHMEIKLFSSRVYFL